MREIEVVIGEVQQMPRPLPVPEGSERDAGLLLEQMQETRRRQPGMGRTTCRRHRLAAKFSDLRDRAHHARIEPAPRQGFAKTHPVELGAGDIVATLMQQLGIGGANAGCEKFALGPRQALRKFVEGAVRYAFRFDHQANRRAIVAGDGVKLIRRHRGQFAITLAAVGGREPQTSLDRDIDMKCAAPALPRAAEQPGINHPLRRDQHQMAGFAQPIVHGRSSSRGSLGRCEGPTIAQIWPMSPLMMTRYWGGLAGATQPRTRAATFCSTPARCSAATARLKPSRCCNRAQYAATLGPKSLASPMFSASRSA